MKHFLFLFLFSLDQNDIVSLKMQDVSAIENFTSHVFLNTGSPHHVQFVKNLDQMDVDKEGRKLRYGHYGEAGSNINFVEQNESGEIAIRTYERGVEGETLSCGTGVTATAISVYKAKRQQVLPVVLHTKGGKLSVSFNECDGIFTDVYLEGPAEVVFSGEITVND